jgi:hypothetical protein
MDVTNASRRLNSGNVPGASNRPILPVLPIRVGRVRQGIRMIFPITHYREFRAPWAVLRTRWQSHAEFPSGRGGFHPLEPPQTVVTSAVRAMSKLLQILHNTDVFQLNIFVIL